MFSISPCCMLFQLIVTYESLSGRDCSCQRPKACPVMSDNFKKHVKYQKVPPRQDCFKQYPLPGPEGLDLPRGLPGGW